MTDKFKGKRPSSGRGAGSHETEGGTPRDTHYAKLRRAYRDAKSGAGGTVAPKRPEKKRGPGGPPPPPDHVHLYGLHTVRAALENPERIIERMMITRNAQIRLDIDDLEARGFPVEIVSPADIDRVLGEDAIHQGILAEARTLPMRKLSDLQEKPLILVLDQVTDPHNVGAILRSAVAFGCGAVITTIRHSPHESGVLAKSASGALELIPYIQITNLAEALGELHGLGFQTIGLDSEGPAPLESELSGERIALVLGSEGKGLRQKTRDTVKRLARLDMPGEIKSLNVSNATAISLYAAHRHLSALKGA